MKTLKRTILFALCLAIMISCIPAASAAEVVNTETYLRTSYGNTSYLEMKIEGSELTVSGKLISENLTYVLAVVGEARKYTEAESGKAFSIKVDLSAVTDPVPVDVYTRQSHNESFWSFVYESVYVEKSAGKYRFVTSAVAADNAAMLSAWLNPGEYTEFSGMPEVKKLSDEIAGGVSNHYTKAYLLHRWVAENIYYDYDSYLHGSDTYTDVTEIIAHGRTVASGYSQLLMWLLRAQGIPAFTTQTYALGLTAQGGSFAVKKDAAGITEPNHEFVEAFADGRWIILDPSWDSNNEYENGVKTTLAPYAYYYFDITPEALSNEQKIISRGEKVTLTDGEAVNENTTENGLKPASWAIPEILGALDKRLVPAELQQGYTAEITRGDFCKLVMNMLRVKSRYTTNGSVLRKYGKTIDEAAFSDTNDPDVLAACALGIVNGTGNGKFHPEHNITREQAATMLKRFADLTGLTTDAPAIEFTDFEEVSTWAEEAVRFISSLATPEGRAVMGGVGEGRFSPGTSYTVQQAILTIYRIYLCK